VQLVAEGHLKVVELAERCGVRPATVQAWKAHPVFKRAVDAILNDAWDDARKILRRNAIKAAEKLVWCIDHGNERDNGLQFKAAKDLLNRVGIFEAGRMEVSGPGGGPIQQQSALASLTIEQLERLASGVALKSLSSGSRVIEEDDKDEEEDGD